MRDGLSFAAGASEEEERAALEILVSRSATSLRDYGSSSPQTR